MQRKTSLLGVLVLLTMLLSCRKQEEIIIPGNTAPPDPTITDLFIESYINRSYITLLGRKAEPAEFSSGMTTLRAHNLSQADRALFLDDVMAKPEFMMNQFMQAKAQLLNGIDTTEIRDQITLFELLLTDPNYAAFWDRLQYEVDRMELVLAVPTDLAAGTLSLSGMHARLINNYVYDQINMGTTNFVKSSFDHFLYRYPTDAELVAAEQMVNGFASQLFLESGDSKTDYLDIFFRSKDYHSGRVKDVYLRALFRDPTSVEETALTDSFLDTGDYKALLRAVLSSDEYTGL